MYIYIYIYIYIETVSCDLVVVVVRCGILMHTMIDFCNTSNWLRVVCGSVCDCLEIRKLDTEVCFRAALCR